jgi:hypothetical protein
MAEDPLDQVVDFGSAGRQSSSSNSSKLKALNERNREMFLYAQIAQVAIAISIVFVWIVRFDNVAGEFIEYGLPVMVRSLVGATKIALSTLLVAGLWYPSLVLVPALAMAGLMVCAQIAHFRVKHRPRKFLPSLALLILSLFVAGVYSGILPR